LGLSTLVVILSLIFWGWVWGPVGALLAVPLTMVVKIMLENTSDLRWVSILLDKAPPEPGLSGLDATISERDD
jgi:predicted PurR-regulated permease PerM